MAPTIDSATDTDTAVAAFRASARHAIEHATGPEDAAAVIAEIFAAHRETYQRARADLDRQLRQAAHTEIVCRDMLSSVGETVARQVGITARAQADAAHAARTVRGLADALATYATQDTEPAVQDVLGALHRLIAETPQSPPAVAMPVTVSGPVPDPRWTLGHFRGASRELVAWPFVGWCLVAVSEYAVGQQPQPAFLVGGRVWTLADLEDRGLALEGMS